MKGKCRTSERYHFNRMRFLSLSILFLSFGLAQVDGPDNNDITIHEKINGLVIVG